MTDEDLPTDHLPGVGDAPGALDPSADAVRGHWADLVADMDALADDYRAEGWTAHAVHPGDVTALAGPDVDREGFDVLAPDDEFDRVEAAVEAGGGFANATVYRAMTNGVLFLLAVLEDQPTETAVLVPTYYAPTEEQAFTRSLREGDVVEIHVRPLDQRTLVTFQADDPSLFLPDES